MTTPKHLAWQADNHGTLMLHPFPKDPSTYVYLQGRRPYCDRGHWEWGSLGIFADHRLAPSYYFMRQETARAEVEAWLARVSGQAYQGPTLADLPNQGRALFQEPHGQTQGWAWAPDEKGGLQVRASDPQSGKPVVLKLEEIQGVGGPAWRVTAEGVPNLDDADRFPRIYLDLAHAKQEVEDFLAWRLLKVACEIPHRFENETRPLNHGLVQRLTTWENRPESPTPKAKRPRPR